MKYTVPHSAFLDTASPADAQMNYYLYRRYEERRLFAVNFASHRSDTAASDIADALLKSLHEDATFLKALACVTPERAKALCKEEQRIEKLPELGLQGWKEKMENKKWPLLSYVLYTPTPPQLKQRRVIKATPAMRKLLRK